MIGACDGSDELLPGTSVFGTEERAGLDLIRSLNDSQRSRAVTRPSIHPDDLPQDNPVPSRNHIHTIVRTPNGGDYGVDLLRQHHERYDHSHGTHEPRR